MNDTLTFTSSVLAPNSPKRKELGPAKITSSFICYVTLPAYPLLFFRFTFLLLKYLAPFITRFCIQTFPRQGGDIWDTWVDTFALSPCLSITYRH